MPSNGSNGWEKLDIMSREKVEQLEEKVLSLENEIKKANEKLSKIENILMENRTLYTDFIKQNHDIVTKVVTILEENRKLYLAALDEVEHKEDENINTLKPMLENVSRQNEILQQNMTSPFLIDRLYNRFWRCTTPFGLAATNPHIRKQLDDGGV